MDQARQQSVPLLWIVFIIIFLMILFHLPRPAWGEIIDYQHSIQENIFNVTCVGCHGKYGVKIRQVDLTSYEHLVENPVLIVPGSPDESLLFVKITLGHGGLSRSEIEDLRIWIIQGASD